MKIKVECYSKKKELLEAKEAECFDAYDVKEKATKEAHKLLAKHNETGWFRGSFKYYVWEWNNWQEIEFYNLGWEYKK